MGVNETLGEQPRSASNRGNKFGCRLRERVQRGWRWQISSMQARSAGLLGRCFVAASSLESRFTEITRSVWRGPNWPRSRS